MNFKHKVRGSRWAFALITVGLFVFLWSRPIPPYAKGDGIQRWWNEWGILLRHDYICSTSEMLLGLLLRSSLFGVPSLIAGWIGQYFIVLTWEGLFGRCQDTPS